MHIFESKPDFIDEIWEQSYGKFLGIFKFSESSEFDNFITLKNGVTVNLYSSDYSVLKQNPDWFTYLLAWLKSESIKTTQIMISELTGVKQTISPISIDDGQNNLPSNPIEQILKNLKSDDEDLRLKSIKNASEIIAQSKNNPTKIYPAKVLIKPLISMLDDDSRMVRKTTADIIISIDKKLIVKTLENSLLSISWRIRYYAAEILCALKIPETIPAIVELAETDNHPAVRRNTKKSLSLLKDSGVDIENLPKDEEKENFDATEDFQKIENEILSTISLLDPEIPGDKTNAVLNLSELVKVHFHDDNLKPICLLGVQPLIDLFAVEDNPASKYASELLIKMEHRNVYEAIKNALNNNNWRIRYQSAELISKTTHKEFLHQLNELFNNDPHPGVRKIAEVAIKNVSPKI